MTFEKSDFQTDPASWWELSITGEPDEEDLEHIAEQIVLGNTSGELRGKWLDRYSD